MCTSCLTIGDPRTGLTFAKTSSLMSIVLLRSTGFIIEGFPQTSDELRFLCSKGFYPDVVVMLQVGASSIIIYFSLKIMIKDVQNSHLINHMCGP